MPGSLNKVMLIGNLGRDAETRHTPDGTAVVNLRIATTTRFRDQSGEWRDRTDWHTVAVWRAENVAPYLTRGKKVFVEGRLQTRSWEGQDGQRQYRTEVVCNSSGLILLGSRDSPQGGGQGGYTQGASGGYGQGGGQGGGQRPPDAGGQAAGPVSGGAPAPRPAPAADSGIAAAGGTVDEDDDIPF